MRAFLLIFALLNLAISGGCGGSSEPATPVQTLKAYTIAMKAKDTTMMKLLLSEGTLKAHQDEANARGVTLDEIVQQQALFPADQRVFDYRNPKIEGEKATVEVKNSFDGWDVVFLVKEGGAWKIDKKATAENLIQEVERQNELLDQSINEGRVDTVESPLPEGSASPASASTPAPGGQPPVPVEPPADPNPGRTPPAPAN